MSDLPTLKQSGFSNKFKLVLEATALSYSHSEVLSESKSIPYRQISGIFRDADRCYIVWGSEVAYFLHETQNADYPPFMEQLLTRVRSSRGA